MLGQKRLTWPVKLVVAITLGAGAAGSCFGAWGYLVGADKPMGELHQKAPVPDPATTAYEGRAPDVAYEADGDGGKVATEGRHE